VFPQPLDDVPIALAYPLAKMRLEDGLDTDLVMVLAYYPEVYQADFIRSGSLRSIGSEFLPMYAHKKDQIVEI